MQLDDEHFRLLVESVRDYAIYLLDPAGIIQSWNAGAEQLKGYRSGEVIGKHFSMFFTAGDREAHKADELLALARERGRAEDIGWRVRKDGTQFWASAVITRLVDPKGRHVGFAKVTRDLTDRSYRAFVEATHSIVWTTDASGRPSSDSPSWRELTGQSEAQWRGGGAWDPVHPDDLERLRVAWATAKAEGTRLEVEFRLRRRDGEYVWMTARALPFRNVDGAIREWFGVTFDISDRKRAEAERERAVDLLSTTLRSIGDAVIATDPAGRITFLNVVAERLTGWTSDAAHGRPLVEVFAIFNEETGLPVESPVDKVLREGVVVGLANHTVLRRRDGHAIPIDDSAAPIRTPRGELQGVVLVFRDASEEKRELYRRMFLARATEQIVEAADFRDALRRIVELACPRMADWAAVDIVDPSTGKLEQLALAHVDPTKIEFARELNRRYPASPDAKTGAANVVRTGRTELYPELPQELLEASTVDAEHLRMIRELELRSALVVPLHGRDRVFGVMTFIFAGTERRYSEQDVELAEELARRVALLVERRKLEEDAALANRMKDEFLATISHELRTPLQAILGYATMLERHAVPDPSKAISAIVRNANSQARLVEDMLDMSRILSGKLRLAVAPVDLATVLREAVESIRPSATGRGIEIVERIAPDIGQVHGDAERLQQIVWNLASNAVKFTPRAGRIEVSARRSASGVEICVRDNGKGIAREHLAAIFERFRQVDSSTTRAHSGLGLGLAIVKYLAEAHGGTVSVESPGLGHGATFTLTFPARLDRPGVAAVRPAAGDRAAESPAAARLDGIRVLVVDDDDDARESIVDVLQAAGAYVEAAASAPEAYARFAQAPPRVLVSDIGMAGEDGYSLCRRIRALPPERGGRVPAIALTAYARAEDAQHAAEAGFQAHVAKPAALDRLVEIIRACLAA